MDRQVLWANVDNISRTKAYEQFGKRQPEIRWARLAGIVSRNAGWNLTDLTTSAFQAVLPYTTRQNIAWIYERANWLIFRDAYPQLLCYQQYKTTGIWDWSNVNRYGVSTFMDKEWRRFLQEKDEWRLMIALIINEQMMIEQQLFKSSEVQQFFKSALYKMEELLHFSHVLFPHWPLTNHVRYGEVVQHFAQPKKRIQLGVNLAHLLYDPDLHYCFLQFMEEVEPTGSRKDYDKSEKGLPLRVVYPRISHKPTIAVDWYEQYDKDEVEKLFQPLKEYRPKKMNVTLAKAELACLEWFGRKTSKS
ncbi:DUF2515 family protein [Bacillus sp. Marseille-P3800]|uniref:DUF2515 family protein n=1 Tax=Bacillus sp. Marseille-P3800 TaxID=2014782 RepID=UPI000C07EE94|nr:DUF2515 family protein [Bacillus sp. Marseille-P3800]